MSIPNVAQAWLDYSVARDLYERDANDGTLRQLVDARRALEVAISGDMLECFKRLAPEVEARSKARLAKGRP
jgi:hypothetical protein